MISLLIRGGAKQETRSSAFCLHEDRGGPSENFTKMPNLLKCRNEENKLQVFQRQYEM